MDRHRLAPHGREATGVRDMEPAAARRLRHHGKLFRNPGNSNSWVKIKLVGTSVNRAAIGAQARISIGAQTHTRQLTPLAQRQHALGIEGEHHHRRTRHQRLQTVLRLTQTILLVR